MKYLSLLLLALFPSAAGAYTVTPATAVSGGGEKIVNVGFATGEAADVTLTFSGVTPPPRTCVKRGRVTSCTFTYVVGSWGGASWCDDVPNTMSLLYVWPSVRIVVKPADPMCVAPGVSIGYAGTGSVSDGVTTVALP